MCDISRGFPRIASDLMTYEVALALLPVFFVLALGYGAGKARLVDNQNVSGLNTLVMSFALPISLFTSLAASERGEILARWQLAAISAVVMGLVYAGTYLAQRRAYRLPDGESAVQALSVAFPNCAAVGLPLVDSTLGPGAALSVAAVLAIGSITLSPATLVILERQRQSHSGIGPVIGRALAKPIVIGPVLGLAWSLLGIPVPHLLQVTLTAIGSITGGVALFLTGLVLSAQAVEFTANAYLSTLVTDVARPALAFLAIRLFGLDGEPARETLLLLAIPAGFFGLLLGIGYGVRSRLAGTTVLFSTVLSAATLAVVIALLPRL